MIIPCYNKVKFIGNMLDSVIAQRWDNIEVIIINAILNIIFLLNWYSKYGPDTTTKNIIVYVIKLKSIYFINKLY